MSLASYRLSGLGLKININLNQHCATSRKVAGSIPDVIRIIHWHNPAGRTMALGSTQPPVSMSTRNISWGVKAAGVYGWQTYQLHVPIDLKSGILNLLKSSGLAQANIGIALPLPLLSPIIYKDPIRNAQKTLNVDYKINQFM